MNIVWMWRVFIAVVIQVLIADKKWKMKHDEWKMKDAVGMNEHDEEENLQEKKLDGEKCKIWMCCGVKYINVGQT
jgi:hypothetical protein